MTHFTEIPINIWDEIKEDNTTYAYVEDYDLTDEQHKKILSLIVDYLKEISIFKVELYYHDTKNDYDSETVERTIKNYGESFFFKRWEIIFYNFTEECVDETIVKLNYSNIKYNDIPIFVYSES